MFSNGGNKDINNTASNQSKDLRISNKHETPFRTPNSFDTKIHEDYPSNELENEDFYSPNSSLDNAAYQNCSLTSPSIYRKRWDTESPTNEYDTKDQQLFLMSKAIDARFNSLDVNGLQQSLFAQVKNNPDIKLQPISGNQV